MVETDDETPAIDVSKLIFDWPGRRFGLDVPQFQVKSGETFLLLGESGSGKSTLLSLICGIITPAQGSVVIGGQDLARLTGARRDRFRAEGIGIIFQMFNLLPYATALDNILLPLRFAPARRARVAGPASEALDLCAALGLPAHLVSNAPASTLSVGQQQRVAVARAMIGAPPLVVADEPTSALDADTQGEFLDLLFEQARQAGSTLLMVSHDTRLAARFDRVGDLGDVAHRRHQESMV